MVNCNASTRKTCNQGRKDCPTPGMCGFALHRIPIEDTPPITQEDTSDWLELVLIVAFGLVLAWFLYTAWPVMVMALR